MKQLTEKFRVNFMKYDYNDEDNIEILLALVDAIIEMMTIVDADDCIDNVSKLSAFINILSGDGTEDLSDIKLLQDIYNESIVPILNHFDEKYAKSSSKNITKTAKEILEYGKSKVIELNGTKEISKDTTDSVNINNLYPRYMNYTEKTVFDSLKSSFVNMKIIYDNFIIKDDYYDKKAMLTDLDNIRSLIISNKGHPNSYYIKNIISYMYELCQRLISIVISDNIISEEMKESIETSFNFIRFKMYMIT